MNIKHFQEKALSSLQAEKEQIFGSQVDQSMVIQLIKQKLKRLVMMKLKGYLVKKRGYQQFPSTSPHLPFFFMKLGILTSMIPIPSLVLIYVHLIQEEINSGMKEELSTLRSELATANNNNTLLTEQLDQSRLSSEGIIYNLIIRDSFELATRIPIPIKDLQLAVRIL